jgi:hypothetical protein
MTHKYMFFDWQGNGNDPTRFSAHFLAFLAARKTTQYGLCPQKMRDLGGPWESTGTCLVHCRIRHEAGEQAGTVPLHRPVYQPP